MPGPSGPAGAGRPAGGVHAASRLFVAVPLSAATRAALLTYIRDALRGRPLPGRVVPAENWHLTLRFLGDTDPEAQARLRAALAAAELGPAFTLSFDGLGAFPWPDRARVLWVGVDEGREALLALAAVVEAVAVSAGWPPEARGPSPHLTLSRLDPPRDLSQLVTITRGRHIAEQVAALRLYRSHLGGGPPRYEALANYPLA